MDTHKANRISRMFEKGASKEKLGALDAWREEVGRARSESEAAYGDFLDSLFFYYEEAERVREGKEGWPSQRNGYGERTRLDDASPKEEES